MSIGPVVVVQLSDLYIVVDEKCEWVRGKPNISCLVLYTLSSSVNKCITICIPSIYLVVRLANPITVGELCLEHRDMQQKSKIKDHFRVTSIPA